ncbi:MAG TPA: hypothetical protein VIM75_02100 [Ohtaekwangia sp.]|uniref:hypothetical protein n=1 Tax=Ohtaekwangia sp. TaxID=2066019 RepID=UPI002F958F1E
MKHYFVPVWLLIITATLSSCKQKQEESAERPAAATSGENEVILTETQPDEQFWLAVESYAKGEYKQSADYIRESIRAMEKIESSGHANKHAIDLSIAALQQLADSVAVNHVSSIEKLNTTFANATKALAHLRLRVTETEFFNGSEQIAGSHFQSAVEHANRYISLHHYTPTREEVVILDDVALLSKRMKQGDKVSEEELKESINAVDSLLTKWETRFNP